MPNRVRDKVNREKQAYDFFIQKGLTPIQSAALVGNFIVESNLDTRIKGDRELSTPSVGIAQWRESRLDNLKKRYDDPYSFENQLDFVWWELNNTEKEAFNHIKQAKTTETAAIAVRQKYERAWAAHDDRRIKFTTDVLNRYNPNGEEQTTATVKTASPQISERGQGQQTIDNTATNNNFEYTSAGWPNEKYLEHLKNKEGGVNENLTNLDIPKENPNFALPFPVYEEKEEEEKEKDPDSKEVSQAKQILNKRKATRDFLTQIVAQNLNYTPVEYVRTNPYQGQPPQMEDGGKVNITDAEGNTREVSTSSQEYRDWYNSGDIVVQTEEEDYLTDLPAVEMTFKASPTKGTFSEEELSELLRQRIATPNERLQNTNKKQDNRKLLDVPKEGLPQEDIDEAYTDFLTQLPETTIVFNKTQEKLKKQIGSKEEGLSPVRAEPIDLQSVGSREEIKEIQKKLSESGYNLNPDGRFKNSGIDGIAGKVTLKAIDEYNKSLQKGEYQSVKEGEGLLGSCTETQCTEYVQNEAFRNLKPNVSREEWNRLTGLHGDAWTIGENIIKAGGQKIENNDVRPGDVVTMYTGGNSTYQKQADEAGTGTTHSGLVDQVNPDGSYYIVHNVHDPESPMEYVKKKLDPNYKIKWVGKEYRTLVKNGVTVGEEKAGFSVRGAFRPNTEGLVEGKDRPLREDVSLRVNVNKKDLLEEGNTLRGTKGEKVEQYIKPLNDFKNKEKISRVFDIDEEEYQSLAKIVIGVIGQESSFGTSLLPLVKQPVATALDTIGLKDDEASKGAGRLKFNTNFHSDLTEFGINEKNFTSTENMPITMMYKIAGDYKNFLKQGYDKKDAMYRAIVIYNASLSGKSQGRTREEWANEYDVDYANKVLNYADVVDVRGEDKNYKTTVDDLLLKDNVLKWSSELKNR